MPNLSKPAARLTALAGVFALVGCASIADVKPGTSYDDVVKQFGNPNVSCPENSGTRAVWTEQPWGETAWALSVSQDKRISSVTQILNNESFNTLQEGQWDTHAMKCYFGPPAKTQIFPSNPDQVVWEYRFLGVNQDYDMLFATFDRHTNQLVKYSIGMDPELNLTLVGGR